MKISLEVMKQNRDAFIEFLSNSQNKLWIFDNELNDWRHYDELMVSHEIGRHDVLTASKDKPTYKPVSGVDPQKFMYPVPLATWPEDETSTVYVVIVDGVVMLPHTNEQNRKKYQSHLEAGRVHDTLEAANKHFDALQYLSTIQKLR